MKDHNIFSSKKHPSHVAQWLRCRFKYLELQGSGVRVPARGVIPTRSLMAIDRFPRGPGGGSESHFFVNFRSLGFPRVGPLDKIFLVEQFCSTPISIRGPLDYKPHALRFALQRL